MAPRCLIALIGLAGFATAQTETVFHIPHTGPVAEISISLKPTGAQHSIELRNFADSSRPVLHVMSRGSRQIASSIAKGKEPVVTLDGKTSGELLLLVRSGPGKASSINTADLWVDGQLHKKGIRYSSGATVAMSRLAPNEKVMGVRSPLGPKEHVLYILSADGSEIYARGSGSYTELSSPAQRDVLVVAGSLTDEFAGPMEVYRNNLSWDTDEDGLSDALERQLGTCASNTGSVAGANCDEIADPRDTDGDGLPDGWEVLGKLSGWYENGVFRTEYLPLWAWGANPRHKDIFIEVDFRRLNLAENQSGLALKMPIAVARQMAASYGDTATTDFWLKIAHAVSVDNPDRLTGINLHFDNGINPTDPLDATLHGDWGGYNPVNAVLNAEGKWVPQRPEQVWQQQMSRGRWGVFHYVMGYASGGGACGGGIACGFNFNDAGNAAHEFGHTLGLNHNGPYGIHEPNCKPNYPSLMNYAYLQKGHRQFADGLNYPTLNNHLLTETNAVSPAQIPLLDVLQSTFQYKIDRATGSVDWNRDGIYAPPGATVRAYANYQPGNSCEYTREQMKSAGMQSERSPAIVHFRNKLLIFSIGLDGLVRYTYTNGLWSCPNVDKCPDPDFASPIPLPIGQMVSVDARTFRVNANLEQIVVAGIRTDGSLIEILMTLDSGGYPAWGTVTTLGGPGTATGELSLAISEERTALSMVYKGLDHTVRYRYRTGAGWSNEVQLRQGGQPIAMHPNTSPGLAYTRLPIGVSLGETLVGAFVDTNGFIQLYSPSFPGSGWGRISIPYDTMYSPVGRPVVAWVGAPPVLTPTLIANSPVTTNRLYILYLEYQTPPDATPTNAMRMVMSHVDAAGTFRIGLNAYFDNVWAFAYGMGVVQPSTAGLRAVFTSAVPSALRDVLFRPHADGMYDLAYRNYDDWKRLGWGTCSTVAPTQTTMFIQCAPPW